MYTPNRRPPPKKKWIRGAIKRPGKLGGKGFMSKSVDQQHRILNGCVSRYGYRSCLGSVMLLHNINSGQKRQQMASLKNWLVREHGGPGTFKRNPTFEPPSKDDGSWDLVPELSEGMLVGNPNSLAKAKLTPDQVEELDRMTNPKNPFYSSYQGTWRGYRTAKTGRPSKAKAKRKARSKVAARSRAGKRIKKEKRNPEKTAAPKANAASIMRSFMRL